MYKDIVKLCKEKQLIKTSDILSLGYTKPNIITCMKNNIIKKVEHGIYALPNEIIDDMYLIYLKATNIIFSHESALFLNGLSERTPFMHAVTIKSNASLNKAMQDNCKIYYIKPEHYELGLTHKSTTFGNKVKCYNEERTICDLLRSRNRVDEEIVVSAIKNYASYKGKDLNLLAEYAEEFKVGKILKTYMEVLL